MRGFIYDVDIDKAMYKVANFKQYDNGINYSIRLIKNGRNIDLSGYTISAFFTNKNGVVYERDTVINDSIVTVVLDSDILRVSGDVVAEFTLFKEGRRITTFDINFRVLPSSNKDEVIQSLPQWSVVERVMQLKEEIETLEENVTSSENIRKSNEVTRVDSETVRVSNESTRISNENTRKSAETSRVNAETSRVAAETTRVSAEGVRVSQENTRKSNETTRVSEFNQIKSEFNDFKTNVEVVQARTDLDGVVHPKLKDRLDNYDLILDNMVEEYTDEQIEVQFPNIQNEVNELTSQYTDITNKEIPSIKGQLESNTNLINDIGTSYSNFSNFSSMEDYIISQIKNNGGASHDQGMVVIDLPAGNFEINDFDVLSKYARRTGGLKFRGRGGKITKIYFNPSENDKYLFKNNDTWLSLRFEGIQFVGNIDKNTNFMLSISNGGAQNYMFTDCFFNNFDKLIDLKGTNNNSEFSFYSCNFNGIIKNCLYCGSDVGSGGDQFLNYNFFGCNYEVSEGNFVNMYRGGNINIWGGSFIHIDGDSESARGGTFFNLPYNSHAYGVERLLVIGARFELRNRNSKLIDCAWNKGNVSFINCDLDCYNQNAESVNWVIGTFKGYDVFTSIKFDNCSLMGKLKFNYNPTTPSTKNGITFENCRHALINNAEDFFTYETNPTSGFYNYAKKPAITIRNCYKWLDTVLNYSVNKRCVTSKKILFMNNINGSLPFGKGVETATLPLGSIITRAGLFIPKGSVTSGYTVNFTVDSGVALVTNLVTASGVAYSSGFNVQNDLFIVCDTDDKRTITLKDNVGVDQSSVSGIAFIEYI